jgi:signal transduction histidine kinase/CHASE3 domain sensor protein
MEFNSKTSSPIFTSIFIATLFLLFFISSISYKQIRSTNESGKQVNHTYQVNLLLEELFSALKDAESGQRGYIITRDSTFLQQYSNTSKRVEPIFTKLRALTLDNPSHQNSLDFLNALIKRRMALLETLVEQNNSNAIFPNAVITADSIKVQLIMGKNVMDIIRQEINKMIKTERMLLKKREEKHQNEIAFNPVMLFLLAFFSLVVFCASFYKITQDEKELQKLNEQILSRNKNLEQQIINDFTEAFAAYKTGDDFFNSLTLDLAAKTGLDYVLVGEIIKSPDGENAVKTFSLAVHGHLSENIQYPLPDGPCEKVIKGQVYTYPAKCKLLFPNNNTIRELNVEGYIGYPLYDSNGNAIGLIAIMHQKKIEDVTYIESLIKIASKRAELELERFRNNRLLETKNIELERQNAELASFNHVASHDLQEPLRKIQTFISRIFEKELDNVTETGKEYFTRIQLSANRMQMLIDDLLTFSRSNKADKVFEETDLNVLLENTQHELAQLIEEKDAVIQSNHLPTLSVIPFQFQQLLINLIGNSLKYSKPDVPPIIKITVQVLDGDKVPAQNADMRRKYYKFTVSDNGVGFEQQYAENIFILFQRLHGRSEYSGTGIGLAICKKIVENHQGFITATGVPNGGASFHIFLPV